jgi:hypothetical protein
VRASTSFLAPATRFIDINSRQDLIGHRPIREEKGNARPLNRMGKAMHPYLAYWAAALVIKLPSDGLWGRFVRWAFWGEHAQLSYY